MQTIDHRSIARLRYLSEVVLNLLAPTDAAEKPSLDRQEVPENTTAAMLRVVLTFAVPLLQTAGHSHLTKNIEWELANANRCAEI